MLNDIDSIRRIIVLYGQLLDDGRFEEWGGLFTDDAYFLSVPSGHLPPGAEAGFRGRQTIVEQVGRKVNGQRGKLHFGGHPVIDIDGHSAYAWWDFIVVQASETGNPTTHAGRYYAKFRKENGAWRYSERISVRAGEPRPDFVTPVPGA